MEGYEMSYCECAISKLGVVDGDRQVILCGICEYKIATLGEVKIG